MFRGNKGKSSFNHILEITKQTQIRYNIETNIFTSENVGINIKMCLAILNLCKSYILKIIYNCLYNILILCFNIAILLINN